MNPKTSKMVWASSETIYSYVNSQTGQRKTDHVTNLSYIYHLGTP